MSERLPRVLEAMLGGMVSPFHQATWEPAADVYRSGRGWLVKFDLAGVRPDEIELRVDGRKLTICGVRRDRVVREDQRSYSMEISYNRFERCVELPSELDGAALNTEYQDGMLMVHLTIERSVQAK